MKVQDLIQKRFSGQLNNDAEYMELIVQVFAVLILGLVLWRMMVIFHRKKNAKRKKSVFFDNTYSRNWRK
ncbi:hypothetical protein CW751_00995 [Brumimicrobium salinarum]|uniref:Uncharacterized protein n=1 Tax=Brumimicrobium salinarum TaxID=2058658 RepID=A0A2I0R5T0_9FLAO|nr:hypothetical protein [Brumimicrobium salinarum]PKR81944.1 hypothetical protein CW751_00995 [Brumimicrobium salinarum]